MQPRRPGLERRQRVDDREVAIAMAVPVDPGPSAARLDDPADKAYHRRGTGRGGVPDRVRDAHARGPRPDRRGVQAPQRLRVCRL